jgi:hypothetical protein
MLNPIEEAKFAELKIMCQELKVPAPPEIMIGLKVHDRNGLLIFDDVQRGHSWNRNLWNRIYGKGTDAIYTNSAFQAGNMSACRTNGSIEYTYQFLGTVPLFSAGAGVLTGIVLGTGDTAFSINQYCLVTPIAHGNGATQMAHSASTPVLTTYNGGTKTWTSSSYRIFNNNSGSSITVKEVGLVGTYGGYDFMFERSVLDPTVPVANGAQLTVTYEISMDFSAID